MSTIRVLRGAGRGPTAVASYDAALAAAGVHNYNLLRVSSVIPAGSTVETLDHAPDLGPVGEALTVVEARATVETGRDATENPACAGLGWAVDGRGRGIFYESSGRDPETVRETIDLGLRAGRDLRRWSFTDEWVVTETAATASESERSGGDDGAYATAVALAAYGESEPIP